MRVGRRKARRGPLPRAPRPAFPELLAPAGSAEAYYAAVDAGADAVYLGLGKFNARERAENFNLADLCRIRPHARARGVRLYVAMNTLLTEADLPEAIGLLHQVAPLQPDAIIAADLGLVRILHEFFPGIPVHMSTQAGCASAEAAEAFARMGVSRVILERHLRKEEIARIAERSPVGVEIFVHGSLCYSYSGKCLFSSYLGGKSGNRGVCVQPCRRLYGHGGEPEAIFSTRDLSLLPHLPDLVPLGIASLKIEGRMRGAEYVAGVVSAYRAALDGIRAGNPAEGVAEGTRILSQVIGRETTPGLPGGARPGEVATGGESGNVGELDRNGGARRGRLGVRPGRDGDFSRGPAARAVPGGRGGAGLLRDRPAERRGRAPGQGAVSRLARRPVVPGRGDGPRGVHPACPQGDGGDAVGRGPLPGLRLSGDGDGQGVVRKRGEGVRVPHLGSARRPSRYGPPRWGTPACRRVPGRPSAGGRPGRDPRRSRRVGGCADPLPPGGPAVRPGVLPRRETAAGGDPPDAAGFREPAGRGARHGDLRGVPPGAAPAPPEDAGGRPRGGVHPLPRARSVPGGAVCPVRRVPAAPLADARVGRGVPSPYRDRRDPQGVHPVGRVRRRALSPLRARSPAAPGDADQRPLPLRLQHGRPRGPFADGGDADDPSRGGDRPGAAGRRENSSMGWGSPSRTARCRS